MGREPHSTVVFATGSALRSLSVVAHCAHFICASHYGSSSQDFPSILFLTALFLFSLICPFLHVFPFSFWFSNIDNKLNYIVLHIISIYILVEIRCFSGYSSANIWSRETNSIQTFNKRVKVYVRSLSLFPWLYPRLCREQWENFQVLCIALPDLGK